MIWVLALSLAVLIGSQGPVQSPADARAPRTTARAVFVAPDGSERAVPLAEFEIREPAALESALVRFESAAPGAPPPRDAAVLELAGGEILCGVITGGSEEHIDFEIAGGIAIRAELERMHELRFEQRLAGAAGIEAPAEGDRIFRVQSSGVERIDGAVEGFTEGGIRFHGELVGTIAVPWRSVAALFVEHLGSKPPRMDADAVSVVIDLDDGSRLAGILAGVRDGAIELNRRGEVLRVPLARVLQLARDDGTVGFLASLTPTSAEPARPFGDDLGMVWRPRVDRNVTGGPLRVAGVRHPRGLGVHAPSRTTWALDGTYAQLRGSVAIDDEVLRFPSRGSCLFRVLLDGREAFASPVLRAGDPAAPFHVELGAAKELALVVESTDDGFAGDRADWLGLVLTRAETPSAGGSQR
jgi:hypothetical protein